MGVVYRAHDPVLHRYVAVKLMSATIARDEQLRDRFLREARSAGSLQHPNIITIYDCGDVEGHLYIAMEYIEGADLAEIITRRDSMTLAGKIDIVIDVLNGLAYAHQRGIVHRDIKPANIRVTEDGHAKIMDFGIAHVSESNMTKSGMLVGTPEYMAPEQITGGKVSPASDVFAVGCVLYELLTYTRPFTAETLHAVLYKVVSEDPPLVRDVMPGIPPDVQQVVSRALAKDPAARYPTATEMAAELTAARAVLTGAQAAPTVVRKTPLKTLVPTAVRRRRQFWMVGGGLAGAAAITVLVLMGPWHGQQVPLGTESAAESTAAPVSTPPEGGEGASGSTAMNGSTPADQRAAAPTTSPATSTDSTAVKSPPPTTTSRQPSASPKPQVAEVPRTPARQSASPPAGAAAGTPVPAAAAAPDSAVRGVARDTISQPTNAATPTPIAGSPSQKPAEPIAEPPKPAVDSVALAHDQIRTLLGQYAHAIESEKIGALTAVYPSISDDQRNGWQGFFSTARNVTVKLAIGDIAVDGTSATADGTLTLHYQNSSTGETANPAPAPFTARLHRTSSGWQISEIR